MNNWRILFGAKEDYTDIIAALESQVFSKYPELEMLAEYSTRTARKAVDDEIEVKFYYPDSNRERDYRSTLTNISYRKDGSFEVGDFGKPRKKFKTIESVVRYVDSLVQDMYKRNTDSKNKLNEKQEYAQKKLADMATLANSLKEAGLKTTYYGDGDTIYVVTPGGWTVNIEYHSLGKFYCNVSLGRTFDTVGTVNALSKM